METTCIRSKEAQQINCGF